MNTFVRYFPSALCTKEKYMFKTIDIYILQNPCPYKEKSYLNFRLHSNIVTVFGAEADIEKQI